MPGETISSKIPRRLAAILAADIVAYSALMGADEERTVRDLKGHQAIIVPMITEHGGRIIDTAGDGILAEFGSVVNAVECAVAIQRTMAMRNAEVEEPRRMEFRIGVTLGDVIHDHERLYGDGVNIAARLQAIAEPGGISISAEAYSQVHRKLPLKFTDRGEQSLKNIATPVRVYRVDLVDPHLRSSATSDGRTAGAHLQPAAELLRDVAAPTVPQDSPSVAVLPFATDSHDPTQVSFADGICEDIITALSSVSRLLVIARSSSFAYRGQEIDARRAGRDLGVAHVLEGSVRVSGTRVRVNAQLVNTATGVDIWAHRYDRDISNAFAVQDEITQEIVTALAVKLTEGEQVQRWRREAVSPEAYQLFARAREAYMTFTQGGMVRAREDIEKAIRINPDFAIAYATLGYIHAEDARFQWSASRADALGKARDACNSALMFNANCAEAHSLLGYIAILDRDFAHAISETARAIAIQPSGADAYHVHAMARNLQWSIYGGRTAGAALVAAEPLGTRKFSR